MYRKNASLSVKTKTVFYLAILFLTMISVVLSGCKEAQGPPPSPQKVLGECEIFDKLPADIKKPAEVNYGGKVKLVGTTIEKLSIERLSLNKLKISYYWQILDDFGPYNKAFVIFSDKDDKQLFGNDHDFCQNRTFKELKDKFIKETYTVAVPPETAIGSKVNVGIGIFAPELKTDVRLKITSAGSAKVADVNTRAIVDEISF